MRWATIGWIAVAGKARWASGVDATNSGAVLPFCSLACADKAIERDRRLAVGVAEAWRAQGRPPRHTDLFNAIGPSGDVFADLAGQTNAVVQAACRADRAIGGFEAAATVAFIGLGARAAVASGARGCGQVTANALVRVCA